MVGLGETDGVGEAEGVGEPDGIGAMLELGDGLGVDVSIEVGVDVGVDLAVADGAGVGVESIVGVAVGGGSGATGELLFEQPVFAANVRATVTANPIGRRSAKAFILNLTKTS